MNDRQKKKAKLKVLEEKNRELFKWAKSERDRANRYAKGMEETTKVIESLVLRIATKYGEMKEDGFELVLPYEGVESILKEYMLVSKETVDKELTLIKAVKRPVEEDEDRTC